MPGTIDEIFESSTEIEEFFADCKLGANSDREIEFVASMYKRWETFGMNMFLSEAQYKWLNNIAER